MSASVEARTINSLAGNPLTSGCSHARSSRAVIARQLDERRIEAAASAPTVVLEQRISKLHAGLQAGEGDGDLLATIVDDRPAAPRQWTFRKADDDLAVLRLLRLAHGGFDQAVDPLELLDPDIARQRQRILDQERGGGPADRPLAEILRCRIPHRHLEAVGHDLELRRRIVLEAHAAGTAHIERTLDG